MQVFFLNSRGKREEVSEGWCTFPKVFHSAGDPEINGVRQDCPSTKPARNGRWSVGPSIALISIDAIDCDNRLHRLKCHIDLCLVESSMLKIQAWSLHVIRMWQLESVTVPVGIQSTLGLCSCRTITCYVFKEHSLMNIQNPFYTEGLTYGFFANII